jgi:formylglycine-generating enzyme required for sulfatase activity
MCRTDPGTTHRPQQERHLTQEQRDIYGRINRRQHFQALETDFLTLTRARRRAEIDKLAAHITGIIEQLSDLAQPAGGTAPVAERPIGRASEPPGVDSALAMGPLTLRTARPGDDADIPALAVLRDAEFAPELVVVPAGEFMMGSTDKEVGRSGDEGPRHRVTIGQRFALGRYPVTFDEYDRFCEATGREKPGDEGWSRGRQPVINVHWDDTQAYIVWLSQETGKTYRLPSEAEWEYACRAGTTTRYSFGDTITPDHANYGDSGLGRTSEVGAYPANPWKIHDMHGNVWEWLEDDWHENYQSAPTDGSTWKDAEKGREPRRCVLRGGSWYGDSRNCRSAFRNWLVAGLRDDYVGFRVARTLS